MTRDVLGGATGEPADGARPTPAVICLGEVLMDLFAEAGVALGEATVLYPLPGGAPANVAVALARLGVAVGFVGVVGADHYGDALRARLATEGVDTTYLASDRRAPTMLALVASPSPTEQHFALYHGANTLLRPEALPRGAIEAARVFVSGSVTLATDSGPAALQAARWAKGAGRQVIFDVNWRPALWPSPEAGRARIFEGLAAATIAKLNADELAFVTGTADPARGCRQLRDLGLQLCCISLGADGAYYDNGVAAGFVPAVPVAVADTTGSGDAFVAGLACGLAACPEPAGRLTGAQLRHLVAFANCCGALATTRRGAMAALPTRAEADRLYREGVGREA